jgi:hypothetical protein
MSNKEKIKHLKETHRVLDDEIHRLELVGGDHFRIQELKRRKLHFKDEITKLEQIDYEQSQKSN